MTRVFASFILSFFFTANCLSQTTSVDALRANLYTATSDNNRLSYLIKLCAQNDNLNADSLWQYASEARRLAHLLNDSESSSLAAIALADVYERWDNTDSARALISSEFLKYNVENAATRPTYFKLARAKIDMFGAASNYKDGLAVVYKTLADAEKYKDSVTAAENMNTIAAWYYDMDRLDDAKQWSYKAIAWSNNQSKFDATRAAIYLNLGENYRWVDNNDSAIICINKALQLSKRSDNLYLLSACYQRLTGILIAQKKLADAKNAILLSLQLIRKRDGAAPQQEKLLMLASVYEKMKQYNHAIQVLQQGITSDSIYKSNISRSEKKDTEDLQSIFYYEELADCYKLQGDHIRYEQTLEKIIAGKDAFYNANSASAIAALEAKYAFQKQETIIAQQALIITQKNYWLYASIVFLILAAIISWLLLRDAKRIQKIKLQKLQEEERRQSAKAIADAEENERKRIAADLHDNLGAQLSFIKRNVDFIIDPPQGFKPADQKKYLGFANDTARNAMIDLRETLWVLNTEEVFIQDFADKLKSYLQQHLVGTQNFILNFNEVIMLNWKLPAGEVMHLFRIFQELLSNVVKHSNATTLNVQLTTSQANQYIFKVMDNGKGFNVTNQKKEHYGLENMQKRAAEIGAGLSITSSEEGTIIILSKNTNTFGLLEKE